MVEACLAGKFFIDIIYEGGDADTLHPQRGSIPGVDTSNFMDNSDIIKEEVRKYKELDEWLS